MASHSAGSVSGPVAMMAGPSGSSSTTLDSKVTSGCPFTASVILSENRCRSTASAPPAGTREASAADRIRLSSARSSAFKRPEALVRCSAFKELEHTSSAKPGLLWAGLYFWGFMSISLTGTPRFASCQAASHPARPAPTTVTGEMLLVMGDSPWSYGIGSSSALPG